MRVLVLGTDSFGGHGGIALYNRDLIEAISRHPDCEEIVVLPRVISRAIEPIPERVRFVEGAARGKAHYAAALARLRGERFDLAICAHVNLLPLSRFIAAPTLLFAYGIEAWKPLRSNAATRQLDRCRGVVSISQITLDRLVAWSRFPGPTFLLPNAIHQERFGVRPRRVDLVERWQLEGRRVVLTVGRVVAAERYKGFDEVIEVLPDLPDDVVYLIAGGGNDLDRLRAKAAKLGVAQRVRFTGDFDERDKADIYALADVYVMPSRGEGFGFVFLEALGSGLPVIGSRHDGGREALRDGRLGLLVDPSCCGELRQAIMEQIAAPKKIPALLESFSFDSFVATTHAIMGSVR
jgi:glycosyltransferase involved in cell wall biosynthesis